MFEKIINKKGDQLVSFFNTHLQFYRLTTNLEASDLVLVANRTT